MIAAEDIRMDEFSKTGEEKAKYYRPKTEAEGKRSQQCKDGKALGQGSPEKENLKRKNSKTRNFIYICLLHSEKLTNE